VSETEDSPVVRGGNGDDSSASTPFVICIGRTDIRQSGVEQLNRDLRSELEAMHVEHEWLDWAHYTPTESRGRFSFTGLQGAASTLTSLARLCRAHRQRGTTVYFPLSQHGWGLARDIVTAVVAGVSGGRRRTSVIHLHGEFRAAMQPRPALSRWGYWCVAHVPRTTFVAQVRWLRLAGSPSVFVPSRAPIPEGLRRARALPKSPEPTLVFLGFVAPSKGFHILIEAFAQLSVPARLVVVGPVFEELVRYERRFCTPERWHRALAMMRSDERIECVGPVYGDDRFGYLRRAWACLLPSFTEGGSVVVQEALAVGTSVIATAVGPLPEMLADSPGHRLVRPMDVQGLCAAMADSLAAGVREPLGVSPTYLDGGTTIAEVLARRG
jgi:glycosyltransferase involved in cell wall biosynthesis